MATRTQRQGAPLRLDSANEWVWHGEQRLQLTPKAFAVLRYLLDHPGRVVTKEEVLRVIWPDTVVSEWALTRCIRQIRRALRETAGAPQYVATVHRRGYQLIGPVQSLESRVQRQNSQPAPSPQHPAPSIVGREAEITQLHRWLEKALAGERQLVFVTGEPGIGKTALVEAFLQSLEASVQRLASKDQTPQPHPVQTLDPRRQTLDASLWIGHGQCIEHYGAGEAYLPVLEALGRLCREPEGKRLVELLNQHAPTWLVQMPALLSPAELGTLQRKIAGTTRERMLREMAEAVEAITAERPLVLWLEDLHWSDYSTLDWLAFVARQREPARLLVIGTYRPVEILGKEHPLRAVVQELHLHRQCEELRLTPLSEVAVTKYLAVRFAGGVTTGSGLWSSDTAAGRSPLQRLAQIVHQRTEGNPLFMVTVVDDLVRQGLLRQSKGGWELKVGIEEVAARVPESLQQMIEKQLERLSPEDQRLLEAASVAGMEFSAAAVAASIDAEVAQVEKQCVGLVRREQFLRARGTNEWPDGTVAARYGFLHALYQQVGYGQVPLGRRIELHRRLGDWEKAAYGERAGEIAAELAVHFERGRDYRRAVQYLYQAGENAIRRSAYVEAIGHLTRGLKLLRTLPDTPERAQHELRLQITLGAPLMATKGWGAPAVGTAYARAWALCQKLENPPQLFPVLFGLWVFYYTRAQLPTAQKLAEQLLHLAHRVQAPPLLLEAHHALGNTLHRRGELATARAYLEQGIALPTPGQHHSSAFLFGLNTGVVGLGYGTFVLWALGYADQALQRSQAMLTLAEDLSHPLSLAWAFNSAAWLHYLRRGGQAAHERAGVALALCSEHGFAQLRAVVSLVWGWALAEQGQAEEGIVQMRQGLAAVRATGAEIGRPRALAVLAKACGQVGQGEEGLSLVAKALAVVDRTGERFDEAELHRLKGELTLQQS